MRLWRAIPLFIMTAWGCNSSADTSRARADFVADVPDIPMREYGARRAAALEAFSDGILVLQPVRRQRRWSSGASSRIQRSSISAA